MAGAVNSGQGHETSFAQIAADALDVPLDWVTVIGGDTAAVPFGVGTFASRSAVMGGGALVLASQRVIEKAQQIAAYLLEAATEDIVQAEGGFAVAGVPDRHMTWRQIATTAYGRPVPGLEPGLQETVFFDPEREAWGYRDFVMLLATERSHIDSRPGSPDSPGAHFPCSEDHR